MNNSSDERVSEKRIDPANVLDRQFAAERPSNRIKPAHATHARTMASSSNRLVHPPLIH
jgi:hypothetical protein